jgi:hypothetical protein
VHLADSTPTPPSLLNALETTAVAATISKESAEPKREIGREGTSDQAAARHYAAGGSRRSTTTNCNARLLYLSTRPCLADYSPFFTGSSKLGAHVSHVESLWPQRPARLLARYSPCLVIGCFSRVKTVSRVLKLSILSTQSCDVHLRSRSGQLSNRRIHKLRITGLAPEFRASGPVRQKAARMRGVPGEAVAAFIRKGVRRNKYGDVQLF